MARYNAERKAREEANNKANEAAEGTTTKTEQPAQQYKPQLLGRTYFQRKKTCPFSHENSPKIDYKDAKLLGRYVSDYGKILPAHISGVSHRKQRELAVAIKRARMIALLPFAPNHYE